MKKIILTLALLSVVVSAQAHGYYRGGCCYHSGYYGGGGWVAPALIGGVIGYELARPNTVVVEQPPVVYVQPQQPTVQAPPYGYHWQQMTNPQTGQLQIVLVPN